LTRLADVGEISLGADAVNLGGIDQLRRGRPNCRTAYGTARDYFFEFNAIAEVILPISVRSRVHFIRWHPIVWGVRVGDKAASSAPQVQGVPVEVAPGVGTVVAAWMLVLLPASEWRSAKPRVALGALLKIHTC